MPFLLIYILKLSVSLAVVFLFYHFVLRKLTFYNWNRWYLLGYTFLSFLIPFINISPVLEKNDWAGSQVINWVPVIGKQQAVTGTTVSDASYSISGWDILLLMIITGMIVMLFRLALQLFSFRRMMKKATAVSINGMNIYQVETDIIPFSFGNSIFINRNLHNENELREIIRHEFVHVKQKHSLDIIWGELLCLINWYNPFAWLLKKSIRQNLEFIADSKVLENGVSKKEYQYLLLKVTGNNQYSIATQFNFSSLKKRIAMMNKMKSAKRNLVRFLFLLPVLSLVLLAFRKETPAGKPGSQYAESASIMFDNSASDVAATPVIADTIPAMITPNSKGYLVNIIDDKGSCMVVIKDKSGKEVERILLAKWKDVKKYEELYGEILLPPPPPPGIDADVPPVPPLPPACAGQTIAGVTPVAIGSNDNVSLSRISSEYEITNKKAVIKLKNGTVENYDLTDKKERAAFEEKYGKLININTNIRTAVNASINSNVNANVNANIATTVIDPVGKTTATGTNVTTIVTPVKFSGGYGTTSATAISSVTAGGVNVIDDEEYVISGKEDILITITRKTTRQELENYKTQMKAKGVELDYDEIEYNDKGMLISISGTLKTSDNRSNFVANDFETLILAMMKKGNRTYFKVSTKDKEVI